LGQWSLALSPETPDDVRAKLGFFGHVAIVRGAVDVDTLGDAILPRARYVGVLRQKGVGDDLTLSGSAMVFWLGDEDGKGHVIETPVVLTSATIAASAAAILPPTVTVGTIYPLANPAARYTGKHVYQSPREALQIICDAFGVEFRVNANATVDVGRPDQLYNTTAPDSIIVRNGAGSDVDLTAVSGSYDTEQGVFDYSSRVLLLGQSTGEGGEAGDVFVTGAADAPVVPYKDMRGNPVKMTRIISESGQTEGSVQARAQLQLNRFNRSTRALAVDADQYQADGVFVVGDGTYVYDPDAGVVDTAREIPFRGELLHPDLIRISSVTWPISEGHTVAFRTDSGVWLDLTRWVQWEAGSSGGGLGTSGLSEIIVGDLPRSLTSPSGNAVQDRVDAAQPTTGDASIPKAPTGLTRTTTTAFGTWGEQIAYIKPSWQAVTQNTDNTAITDLSHYEVRHRAQFRAPGWSGTELTSDLTLDVVAAPGLMYDLEVRAVDKAGNGSDWVAFEPIMAATDSGAPPAPADPVVTSNLGQLKILYIGTDNLGNPMPADTLSVGVYVAPVEDFEIDDVDVEHVTDLNPFIEGYAFGKTPYWTTVWVRLFAIDAAGNLSASSAAMPSYTFPVLSDDIFAGAVGSEKLADLAVITAKINDLAVNNAKIGNVAVGKLTAGIMSADVTISGRFTTALTGARVELNALGFQKYDAGGQLMVSITGSDALLTGRYRSAVSGRRIEMGSGGGVGEIDFYAPDNAVSFLRSYTDGTMGREGLQLGTQVSGASGTWNSIFYNQQEWASYQTKIHDFVFQDSWSVIQTANQGVSLGTFRMQINPTGWALRAGISTDPSRYVSYDFLNGHFSWNFGAARAEVTAPLVSTASPALVLGAADGYGAILRASTSGGVFFDVRTIFDNGFLGLRAGAYVENSDARGKTAIKDAPISDALTKLAGIKAKKFRRKDAKSRSVVNEAGETVVIHEDGDEELGAIAQELPAEVVHSSAEGELGANHMGLILLAIAGIQELDARTKGKK